MSSSTSSNNAAAQANVNVNTKRSRKQANNKNAKFDIFDPLEPKSKRVSEFHMEALLSQARAEKAAAEKASTITAPEAPPKMKEAALPPALTKPFAGVAASPAQRVMSGSTIPPSALRQVSTTFSDPSSKSSALASSGKSKRSPWGNTGPMTLPRQRPGKDAATNRAAKPPTATKTKTTAPSPDKDGWIEVVSKNAAKNAAPPQTLPPVVKETDKAPKMSRRQKKAAAAALAAAQTALNSATPPTSLTTSTTPSPPPSGPGSSPEVAEPAQKQQADNWTTVSSKKKTMSKAPAATVDEYIWDESEAAMPWVKKSASSSKKSKAPVPNGNVPFPPLSVSKPSPPVESRKMAAVLKVQDPKTTKPKPTKNTASPPDVTVAKSKVDNFTQLTGHDLETAMVSWRGCVSVEMARLASMVANNSFVTSTPEPAVDGPVVASHAVAEPEVSPPATIAAAPKKKKSGAQQKKEKKAKAAAEAYAADHAIIEQAILAQSNDAADVSEIVPSIGDKSTAEDLSSSAPKIVQESTVTEQDSEKLVTLTATIAEMDDVDMNGDALQVDAAPSASLLDIPVNDSKFSLEHGFEHEADDGQPLLHVNMDDSCVLIQHGSEALVEEAGQVQEIAMTDSRSSYKELVEDAELLPDVDMSEPIIQAGFEDVIKDSEQIQDIKMNDSRFTLQFGFEELVEELSATDLVDSWVPPTKPKIKTAFAALDVDTLRLCDIVQAEMFFANEQLPVPTVPSSCLLGNIEDVQADEPSSFPSVKVSSAPVEDVMAAIDIRVNHLHLGSISISEIIEGVAQEATINDTYSKEQVAKVFVACSKREREMVGMAPAMGASNADKVLQSPILQNIVRIGRTKLADFIALLEFENDRATLLNVVQACIVSAEKEISFRKTAIGKTVARALGSYVESKM